MAETNIGAPEGRFQVRVSADSHFAWLRTRLSVERTLMAWLRTAVSLIGFGFAIVQFFDRLEHMTETRAPVIPDAPKYLGLALIACGVVALLVSLWQYWTLVRYLRTGSFEPIAGVEGMRMPPAAVGTAVLLTFIGLFALSAVLFRLT